MAQPNYISFASPELQAQQAALERQQQMADYLRQQSMTPLESTSVSNPNGGSIAVKTSPWAGLAKLGQAYFARQGETAAAQKRIELAQAMQQSQQKEVTDYMNLRNGIPGHAESDTGKMYNAGNNPDETNGMGYQPAVAAVPPNKDMANALALSSNNPTLSAIGAHQMTSDIDRQQTAELLKGIQNQGGGNPLPPQGVTQPVPQAAPPQQPPAPISTDNSAPTQLSPASQIAAPAGPISAAGQQAIAADMAKRGDMQGISQLPISQASAQAPVAPPAPLTPLEQFAKTAGYTEDQAQRMVMSGNKGLMTAGKNILDGYQKAKMETLIKQPFKAQQATQAQGAAQTRTETTVAGAADRQQNSFLQKLADTTLTPEALDNAAENYRITGNLPALGMGGLVQKAQILNRAAQMSAEHGDTAEAVASRQIANKANSAALTQITKQEQMVGAFEKNATKNADLALSLAGGASSTGVPIVTGWVQAGMKNVAGDPKISQFHAATETFINEYAKIMSGSMGNTAISDSARTHAHSLLSTAMNPNQYSAVIQTLKQEMQNRMQGFAQQKQELLGGMGMSGVTPTPAAPVAAAPKQVLKFDAQGNPIP